MGRPRKYKSDGEKIKAFKEQQNNYAKKNWKCNDCDCNLLLGNKSNHFKSKKHLKNMTL
jgi:aryl-phospho-beta-D-glucosidase BglC (GH1 family)